MCDEVSSSLATQCLAFCQTLASQGQSFNFCLTLGTSFSFSLDTKVKAPVPQVTRKKKTSPSTQRRNDRRRKLFLESKQTGSKSAEQNGKLFSCEVCDFSETSTRKDLNIHMIRQHKDLEQLDCNISLNSTVVDVQKQEMPAEQTLTEDILTLKLDLEYWTGPRGKAPPSTVHHPQEGLGTSPNLHTNASGFDQISYKFKTGVIDVFEIT